MDLNNQGKENMQHVMQVPTSPSFLKPKPILLRKKSTQPKPSLPLNEVDVNKRSGAPYLIKSPFRTRNPFRRNEVKRKREAEIDDDSNSLLWKRVNESPEEQEKVMPSPVVPHMLDECALSSFGDTFSTTAPIMKEKVSVNAHTDLPVDWSLKSKIRFTSSVPFPNRGNFRTFEEVNGTIGFVRCLHSNETDKTSDVDSSHGSKIFQHSLLYMHPNLPWLKLFPRMNSSLAKQNSSFALDPTALKDLHSEWCDSFLSLYKLVRLYQCPYFYMCAPTFTLLFRCAGAASIPVLHAFISPTTKGFRKALKEEGITFTMPLCDNKDSESLSDDTVDMELTATLSTDKELSEDPDSGEEDDPEIWLENLGLSQDSINKKQKRRNDPSYIIDHKPESLVYVEDSETQGLVNFLLNSQFCTAKTGPMAGIPPTFLAPTAFVGGTLKRLQIRHGKVKHGDQELDSIEINGPLLPNMVHSLCTLFNHTQKGEVSSALTTHSPTAPFSMVCPQSPLVPTIFAKNNIADCGMPDAFVQQMCSKPAQGTVSRVDVKDGLFMWK